MDMKKYTMIVYGLAEMEAEIDNAVERAIALYNKIVKATAPKGVQYDDLRSGEVWRDGAGDIFVRWSESWGYGGHEEGEYHVPNDWLDDSRWVDVVTRDAEAKVKTLIDQAQKKSEQKCKEELYELDRLKKKYADVL